MFRKPKLPCVAFASDNAYAAFKYADLDKIAKTVNGNSFRIYDREGMEFEYLPEHAFLTPAFATGPIKKKDLVARVFDCGNMAAADGSLRNRNLDNIRFDDLVHRLAGAVAEQSSHGGSAPTASASRQDARAAG